MISTGRRSGLFAVMAFGLAACGGPGDGAGPDLAGPPDERPRRIVSLDYCADQYVLKFVDRERILAVSPDAAADFSYMRDAAAGASTVRPVAEDVLLLKPDLVVRSYGGGPKAAAFFERAGVPVLNVGWASDLEGVKAVIMQTASGLGEAARGREVVAKMEARLASVEIAARQKTASPQTALYITSGGVTTGPGSLVHEALEAAGLKNYQAAPGWRAIPLERLAYDRPDVVAAAFFDTWAHHMGPWSAARHPMIRSGLRDAQTVTLDASWTLCAGWFLADAVEALADAADEGARLEE